MESSEGTRMDTERREGLLQEAQEGNVIRDTFILWALLAAPVAASDHSLQQPAHTVIILPTISDSSASGLKAPDPTPEGARSGSASRLLSDSTTSLLPASEQLVVAAGDNVLTVYAQLPGDATNREAWTLCYPASPAGEKLYRDHHRLGQFGAMDCLCGDSTIVRYEMTGNIPFTLPPDGCDCWPVIFTSAAFQDSIRHDNMRNGFATFSGLPDGSYIVASTLERGIVTGARRIGIGGPVVPYYEVFSWPVSARATFVVGGPDTVSVVMRFQNEPMDAVRDRLTFQPVGALGGP